LVHAKDFSLANIYTGLVSKFLPFGKSILLLLQVNFDGHIITYDFNELDEIYLAYATSIHKSQGAEYPAVVIPISTQHYMLLARNLLYTRGKKLVVIIGQTKALAMAIKNASVRTRITNLQSRLQEMHSLI